MAQEFEGLYVKFGANTVEFDNSVKGMNSALSTLKKDLQTLNKQLKFDPGNVDLLAKKMQNFQQQIDVGNKKIAELRKQQKDLGEDKIGTAEWQKLESEIGKTEAQMQVVNRAIDETQKKLNQFKPGTVEYALRKIDEETQNLEKSLKLLDKELQLDPTNVEKLNQKFGMLERSAELSQEKVALLKKEQDKLGDSELNSKEWQRLESEIDDAENALADAKIEMKNVSDELKDVADNAEEAAKEAEKLAEELKAVTPGNIEHVNKKLDEMAEKAEKTADKVGKIKDGFEKAGNAAKPFSALAIAGLGASAVAAGNLQEQTAKTGAVFKEQTKEMDTFAKSSLENFNMAENTSREIMNTYGAMGSGLGLTAEENAKLAKSLTGLTADTVAFNDVSSDRAKTALKGIYTGETESLKELIKTSSAI